jgi:hypothetical protein
MENPIADVASPIAKALPNFLKLDALAQTAVLYWYLFNQTNLPDNQIYITLGLNAVVHGLLHDVACGNQAPIWT